MLCEEIISDTDYPFAIRPLTKDKGGGYLIEFPDLPGCISDGDTVEEAIGNGQDAKRTWIAAMREAGRPTAASGSCAHRSPCTANLPRGRDRRA